MLHGEAVHDLDLVKHERDATRSAARNVPDLVDLKCHLHLMAFVQERHLQVEPGLRNFAEKSSASVHDPHVSLIDPVCPCCNLHNKTSR